MSRPATRRHGLTALRAAVAESREQELTRGARAALVSDGEAGVACRIGTGPRIRGAAAVVVPAPSPASDGEMGPPTGAPEGDAAVSLALVHRAQAGDAEAFGELYDRYVDLVYRYIYYRVASSQLAEDLTSETFLRALRRISSFTWQGRDVGAWFVTIARNLVADHYKSGRYRLEVTAEDVSVVSGATEPVEDGPEVAVLEALQNRVLLDAVRQLNPEQQECIVLRFLQGLSVAETARIMGKNDGAIKALQYRAIRSLGRLLPEGVEL
ncbi:MAG: adsA [Frankiales bacterium]|jgi:RNA polymerase sigma-70 factor (ECF subfamily)|nr:adsA [Frankiales bacterium]